MSYKGGRTRPEGSSQDRRQPPNALPELPWCSTTAPVQTRRVPNGVCCTMSRIGGTGNWRSRSELSMIEVLPMLRGDPARVDREPDVNSDGGESIARRAGVSRPHSLRILGLLSAGVETAKALSRAEPQRTQRKQTLDLLGGLGGGVAGATGSGPGRRHGLQKATACSRSLCDRSRRQTALSRRSNVRMDSINWRGGW